LLNSTHSTLDARQLEQSATGGKYSFPHFRHFVA